MTAGHTEKSVYNVRTLELVVRKRCFQPLTDMTVTWGEVTHGSAGVVTWLRVSKTRFCVLALGLTTNIDEHPKVIWKIGYDWLCMPFRDGRSQWPRGLRCGSAVSGLLGLRVRIPQGAWMSVSCRCCLLSDRGLCVGLITYPEESYRMWSVWVLLWRLDNEEALAH